VTSKHSIMMTIVWTSVLLAGCSQPIHRQQMNKAAELGETLPEWAFDAPQYFRPPPDAVPKPVNEADPDYPLHYYVNKPIILLERPANKVPVDWAPRIAVWWTNTNGCLWTRAGYFGVGQTHFPYMAGDEGDYGIRFVGPGIRESLTEETIPHRIYHYDATPPLISVELKPEQPVYEPNQVVWLYWTACDANIDIRPVRLAVCWSWENPDILELRQGELPRPDSAGHPRDQSRIWKPLKPAFDAEGAIAYTIPGFAAGEGFQFQVRAKDKAGNYGVGYSKVIFVSGYQTGSADHVSAANSPTTQPAGDTTRQSSAASPQPEQINPEPVHRKMNVE